MMPTIDERLASVVRALSEVVLPHLPAEASLAQEQVQLCIGHLQILRAQIDQSPQFEREELHDARALSRELLSTVSGGVVTTTALDALAESVAADDGDVRGARLRINTAIDALVAAVSADGTAESSKALRATILRHEAARSLKDRNWFAPYGFDTLSE